jgi:uncharacterized protein
MERTKEGEFGWIDLMAKDLEAQTAFYEQLFGWTHNDPPMPEGMPTYRMFLKDGKVVAAISQMNPDAEAQGMPSMWNLYIATPDADAFVARAEANGAKALMPVMDVMDQGRMAWLQDPQGANILVWQAGAHKGAEAFMDTGTLGWADLTTRDPEGSMAFYSALVPSWEFKLLEGQPGMPYWQIYVNGEGQGGVMPMSEQMPAEVPNNWMIYFMTEDARATVERAMQLGATVNVDVTEVPGMLKFAVLGDPAGATFAVLEPFPMA